MNKFYLVNYNKLFSANTDSLIEFYLDNNCSFSDIAHDVLFSNSRLLNNDIDMELLTKIVEKVEIEDLWNLASCSKSYIVSNLAYERLMKMIDEISAIDNRRSFKLIK